MEIGFSIFGIRIGLVFEFHWHKDLSGTRKKYISCEFYIQDLRI